MKMSSENKNIINALISFQKEISNPKVTAVNPYFNSKYTPLSDLLDHVKPLLTKHGLGVIQATSGNGETVSVTTLILHTSGEWFETDPLALRPAKNDPQGAGSAITYARRYALSAVLGIASEPDDDANVASASRPQQQQKQAGGQPQGLVTDKQKRAIWGIAKSIGMNESDIKVLVKKSFDDVDGVSKLTVKQASKFIDMLNQAKTEARPA